MCKQNSILLRGVNTCLTANCEGSSINTLSSLTQFIRWEAWRTYLSCVAFPARLAITKSTFVKLFTDYFGNRYDSPSKPNQAFLAVRFTWTLIAIRSAIHPNQNRFHPYVETRTLIWFYGILENLLIIAVVVGILRENDFWTLKGILIKVSSIITLDCFTRFEDRRIYGFYICFCILSKLSLDYAWTTLIDLHIRSSKLVVPIKHVRLIHYF